MKIVVTGGAGFIGSNLAKYFASLGHEVMVVDCFNSGARFSNGNFKAFGHYKNLLDFDGYIHSGDICEGSTLEVIADFAPHAIYHEAAISDTTVSEQDAIMRTNINAFNDLLALSLKLGAKLIYASSGAVYGDAPSPQKIWHSEMPKNAYGFSKFMMDKISRKWCKEHSRARVVGLRYFNAYGGGEFFKGRTASMILQFGLQILKNGSARLFEGSDKICRDFVYVKDIISANALALNAPNGVYNAGTGIARSFEDIVDILGSELGIPVKKEYIPNPFIGAYQFHTQADISKSRESLKYEPKYSLEEGIKDNISYIKFIFESEQNA